jgi:autotransporter-associated beta strand protein
LKPYVFDWNQAKLVCRHVWQWPAAGILAVTSFRTTNNQLSFNRIKPIRMKTKLLILGALLTLQCASTQAQIAITTNTLPPSVGPYDRSYLPGQVDEAAGAMTLNSNGTNNASGDNDVLTYVAGDQQSKGQSFTTGSNPMGYTISSVIVRHILWDTNFLSNGTYMSVPTGSSFDFRFGTISATNANGTNMTITAILTTNATYSGAALSMGGGSGTGIYFTFVLSGAGLGTLSPNTTYFFEIASEGVPPYFELHNTRTNVTSYTGGTAFYGDTTARLDQSGVVNLPPYGGEFAFVAKLAAMGAPSVVAVANPSSGEGGQTFTITATVIPGVGTATNVSVNLSAIGGSSAASLVLSNANVYTNTFTVPSVAPVGDTTLTVTAKDTTPLVGAYDMPFTVLSSDRHWTGGSSTDDNWSDSANWQSNSAPFLVGNNLFFAGTTRLTPNMDNNYSIIELVFSNTAGSFTIGSSTGGTLTIGSGGIVNNSANAQTLNVPVVLSAAQTFNAAAGNLTLNSNITGGVALTLPGAGTVTLAGTGSSAIGDLLVANGPLKVTAGTVTVSATQGNTKIDTGGSVEVDTGATLNIANGGNAWFPVSDTSGTTNTLTINGGTVNVNDNWGIEVPRQGNAVLNINSGSMTVNDSGGVGLIIGDQGTAQIGVVNLNGGTLAANRITANNGASAFYFNGGTLKPVVAGTFFPNSAPLSAFVRDGGAKVDTAGLNVTIGQALLHSTVGSDNAVDGGLTKISNGTLTLSGGYSYTGPTKVLGGGLAVNTALVPAARSDLLVSNAAFTVIASSNSLPVNNLTLMGATPININYGTLSGIPTNAAIAVAGGFSTSGTNVINITGSRFMVGLFPLVDSTGAALPTNDFILGSIPIGVGAVLTNNAGNTSLALLVTAVANTLSFLGTDAGYSALVTNWDINISSNWWDANQNVVTYKQYNGNTFGDFVTFGDNDIGLNVDGTNIVNLPGRVVPASVTINNGTSPCQLTGAGGIDGSAALVVNNFNSFLLGTSNNYTGGTFINAGTLIITNDSALGASSNVLTISGGTLQIAGNTVSTRPVVFTTNSTVDIPTGVTAKLTGSITGTGDLTLTDNGTLTLSPAGTSLFGNLRVSNGQLNVSTGTVNVSDSQGSSTRVENNATIVVSGGTLNLVGSNVLNGWFPIGVTAGATGAVVVAGGTFNVNDHWGTEVGNESGAGVLTINSGAFINNDAGGVGLLISDGASTGGTVNLNGGALIANQIGAGSGAGGQFYFNGGTLKPLYNNAGFWNNSAKITASVRNGGAMVDTAGFSVRIAQPLLHSTVVGDNAMDGGLTKIGNGTLTLNGTNTYTGPTVVNAGALAGTGAIVGALTNNATLAPGSGGVGTLTIAGKITLNAGSTNTFALNGTMLANSSVTAGGNVAYGGVLNIVPSGTFIAGQHFQLFSGIGATNTGNFASIVGSPGSGLAFSFTNGVLSVVTAGPSSSQRLAYSYSGGVLSLSWPAGEGWRLQAQTNSLSAGLGTNWMYLTDGSASSTNITVDPTKPVMFYRLTYP